MVLWHSDKGIHSPLVTPMAGAWMEHSGCLHDSGDRSGWFVQRHWV